MEGNETADRYAKAAAGRSAPCHDEATPGALLDEASLSYMTRPATEARSRTTAERIIGNDRAERRYRPPPGGGLRRRQLVGTRKEPADRVYQVLSGHANIGSFLHRIGTVDDDTYWLCDTGQRQTRFHLVARCPTSGGSSEFC